MSSDEVNDIKNEEGNEEYSNDVIETNPEEASTRQIEEVPKQEEVKEDIKNEETKPKAKPKKQARSVKVVELVECNDCGRKMTPKSLRHTHPHYCKGQPAETLPIHKQKASHGTKVEQKLRKEIEEEMRAKYQTKQEQPEVNEVKKETPVRMTHRQTPREAFATMPEVIKQPTARELLEASYAEIRRAKREAHIEKINGFKSKMF